MGYTTALGLREMLSLDVALEQHLLYNHYPPVPVCMVKPCKLAIEAYQDEDYDRMVDLPEGILWRNQNQAPARAIVEAHHLDAFLVDIDLED